MENCACCTYLDLEDKKDGKFWCDSKLERHFATDPKCGNYCKAYSRDNCTIKNAIEYSQSYESNSPCYLTTILCSILKLNDDKESIELKCDSNTFQLEIPWLFLRSEHRTEHFVPYPEPTVR